MLLKLWIRSPISSLSCVLITASKSPFSTFAILFFNLLILLVMKPVVNILAAAAPATATTNATTIIVIIELADLSTSFLGS